MTRDDFMEFFRDDEKLNTLSTDDRIEVFETILVGSSDLTAERVDGVLQDYGTNLKVVVVDCDHNYEHYTNGHGETVAVCSKCTDAYF